MSMAVSMRTTVVVLATAVMLAGCQTDSVGPKTVAGAGIGAAIGGLGCAALGGNTGVCLASAGVGALVGGAIGAQLDERDRELRAAALQRARVTAKPTHWSNPKSGNSGTITPLRAVTQNGQQCQVVRENVSVKGEPQVMERTVCP